MRRSDVPPRDVAEVTRQQQCATAGHDLPIDDSHGTCTRCGLTVNPPPDGGGERAAA